MRKKLIALLAAAVMTVSFAGCGDKKEDTTATTTEATTEATDTEATDTEATGSEPVEGSTEVDIPELTAERGTIENGVFTNNAFKISFPIADDYTVLTDEQIAESMSLGAEMVAENGTISAEAYEEATNGSIYDLMFTFADGQSNVSVTYINMAAMGASGYTAEAYADALKTQLETMTSPVYTVEEPTNETYGGQEYVCISAATNQGASQKALLRTAGDYMIMITITYLDSTPELVTDFLNSFTVVE